jgi:starch synthase
MKIMLVAAEVAPLAKTGGLADVAGSLPKALKALGHDIRIILPAYPAIDIASMGFENTGKTVQVRAGDKTDVGEIFEGKLGEVIVYLIKCDSFFNRPGIYGPPGGGDFPDNASRFSFFCNATLETLKVLSFQPEIIHCNDWHTGLIPGLLRTRYKQDPFYQTIRTLYTIHNLGYQGVFSLTDLEGLGLDPCLLTENGYLHESKANFMKGGIMLADALNTVSPNYAREIQTADCGFGLNQFISQRREQVFGILNGIDYEEWNPVVDPYLTKTFSVNSLKNKEENKLALQRELGLNADVSTPVLGLVSRLAEQKGIDLLVQALPILLQNTNLQFVGLGTGENKYEDMLQELAKEYPRQMRIELHYNEILAHRIYAGSDLLVIPSRYEPCGLSQMISLRYGTIPIARATGGLADTVVDYSPLTGKGNGFVFENQNREELQIAVQRALKVFSNETVWGELMVRAMQLDYSWKNSALEYLALYYKITVG